MLFPPFLFWIRGFTKILGLLCDSQEFQWQLLLAGKERKKRDRSQIRQEYLCGRVFSSPKGLQRPALCLAHVPTPPHSLVFFKLSGQKLEMGPQKLFPFPALLSVDGKGDPGNTREGSQHLLPADTGSAHSVPHISQYLGCHIQR